MLIPRLIHQIWLQGIDNIPSKYETLRYSWLEHNPTYYYRLWDEVQLLELLRNTYPMFLPTYRKLIYTIQKVHFFEYILMYHFGGVIAHVDILNNQNIESILEGNKIVFASKFEKKCLSIKILSQNKIKEGPYLSTAFMASCERNPFWLEVLREMMVQSAFGKDMELFEPYIHRSSGSTLLSIVYSKFKPVQTRILEKKYLDPAKGLNLAKMITLVDFRSSKRQNFNSFMVDQHYHVWSKNKKIFPILICSLFLVLAAVVIKVTILKKSRPRIKQDKKTKYMSQIIEVTK